MTEPNHTFKDLAEEQKSAIKQILTKKIGCIAPDCGFGKTIVFLTSFAILKYKLNRPNIKALVVCTPKGVKETWTVEHLKWSHTRNLKVLSLVGPPAKRAKILVEDGDIYCISYNSLKWLAAQDLPHFDYVFADEGSCLKGHKSKWREDLIKCVPGPEYKIISTATPAPHDAMDYWGLCKYLDDGKCLNAPNITTFRQDYCIAIPGARMGYIRHVIDKKKVPLIEDKVKHLFWSYSLSTAAKISKKIITVNAKLSPKSLEIYNTVLKDQCLNSIILDEFGRVMKEQSLDAMALSNKMAQITNGFVYVDEALRLSDDILENITDPKILLKKKKSRIAIDLFDDRVKAFKKMIQMIHHKHGKDTQIGISYNFKHDLEKLQKYFPTGVSDAEDDIINRWDKGEIPYLFLQYARSSKSLNLQKGGHILAIYSPTFNWEHDYQLVRRFARQGQPEKYVYVYRLYFPETIDKHKTKVLGERAVNHRSFQMKIRKS